MVIKLKSKKANVSKDLRDHLLKVSYFVNVKMRFGENNFCVCSCACTCVFFPWGEISSKRTRARAKYSIHSSKRSFKIYVHITYT